MENSQIETKIKYFEPVRLRIEGTDRVVVCHPNVRKDYHEDGSVSTYYGFEMSKKSFKRLRKVWEIKSE